MAISVVGTPGVYENASSTAALVPPPTGVTQAQIDAGVRVVVPVEHSSTAAIATPSGWSLDAVKPATASVSVSVFSKMLTASEPATWSFPMSATAGRVSGLSIPLLGVDQATWVDATPTSVAASGSQSTIPAATTVTDGAYLLSIYGINASSSTDGVTPTGFTELARNAAAGSGVGRRLIAAGKVQGPAGSTGTVQWVTNPSASLAQVALLIPYRPATSGGGTTPATPTAAFTANPTSGTAPLTVTFTDTSTGSPTSWAWDFGDGSTSTAQGPSHTYASAGSYTATLTATNAQGSTSTSKAITATSSTPTPALASRVVGVDGGVKVRTTDAASVRLRASTDSAGTVGVVYSSAVTPDGNGVSYPRLTSLTAGTRYYYRVMMTDSGGTETADSDSVVGRIRIAPSGPTSFAFCFAACCNASDSASMAAVAARNDDMFLHLGDLWYADASGTGLANYLTKMGAKVGAANHKAVFATTPTSLGPSDHDSSMNNNGNAGTDATALASYNAAFRQYLPTPADMPSTTGIYHAWTWGRVLFLQLDCRSFATIPSATDNSSKTLLGATQKQWVKDQISSTSAAAVVLVGDTSWIGAVASGDDAWIGYTTERAELGAFFQASGKSICYLGGDMHALAADSGANSVGGIPVFQAAPLSNTASIKGGPYSAGTYPISGGSSVQQYGRMVVTDTGSSLTFAYTGYSSDDTARITQTWQASVPSGSGSASVAYSGTGAGTSPVVGANAGSGNGQVAYSGSGSGSTTRSGGGGAALAYGASGSGYTVTSGGGQGSLAYAGSGSGTTPAVPGKSGSGNAALAYSGSGSGSNGNQTGGLSILGKDGVWHGLTLSRV